MPHLMRGPFSIEHIAKAVNMSTDRLQALRSAKLLDLDGDGVLDEFDLLRAWFIATRYPEAPMDDVRAGIRESSDAFVDIIFPRGSTVPTEDIARRVGITEQQLDQLVTALGIDGVQFDDRDVAMLSGIKRLIDLGLPWDAAIEGAQVMGETLSRLAETEVRLFHFHVHERLRAQGVPDSEVRNLVQTAGPQMLEIISRGITHIHERHLQRANAEDIILFHLDDASPATTPGAMEATILFADLALFTSIADEHGDEAAADLLDRFAGSVRSLVTTNAGRLVKQIGDAFMIRFLDPADAMEFAGEILDRAAEEQLPLLHIGAHHGPLLYRNGDYVGTTVNVASRIAAMAMAGEVLMTKAVADSVPLGDRHVESAGVRVVRGVRDPMPLFRLIRTPLPGRDPVCGALVESPAARLNRDGEELAFCSEKCLKEFLTRV